MLGSVNRNVGWQGRVNQQFSLNAQRRCDPPQLHSCTGRAFEGTDNVGWRLCCLAGLVAVASLHLDRFVAVFVGHMNRDAASEIPEVDNHHQIMAQHESPSDRCFPDFQLASARGGGQHHLSTVHNVVVNLAVLTGTLLVGQCIVHLNPWWSTPTKKGTQCELFHLRTQYRLMTESVDQMPTIDPPSWHTARVCNTFFLIAGLHEVPMVREGPQKPDIPPPPRDQNGKKQNHFEESLLDEAQARAPHTTLFWGSFA